MTENQAAVRGETSTLGTVGRKRLFIALLVVAALAFAAWFGVRHHDRVVDFTLENPPSESGFGENDFAALESLSQVAFKKFVGTRKGTDDDFVTEFQAGTQWGTGTWDRAGHGDRAYAPVRSKDGKIQGVLFWYGCMDRSGIGGPLPHEKTGLSDQWREFVKKFPLVIEYNTGSTPRRLRILDYDVDVLDLKEIGPRTTRLIYAFYIKSIAVVDIGQMTTNSLRLDQNLMREMVAEMHQHSSSAHQ